MAKSQKSKSARKEQEPPRDAKVKPETGAGATTRQHPVWIQRLPLILVICAPILFLLPFVNKAFHIDDTVFIWVGRQIQHHPLDFFGFKQNWFGTLHPMATINKNPPGVSFYLALVTALVGENEIPVHIAFLPIAAAISLGTFLIGRQIGLRPGVAAIASACCVLTPAYLVSCTNVMSDPLMLAWYVWAVFLWIRGTQTHRLPLLIASGMCIACSVISKYFGLSAVPLLLAYSITHAFLLRKEKGAGDASIHSLLTKVSVLLIPIVAVGVYQWWTNRLYGTGLFLDAASYAQQIRSKEGLSMLASTLVGLSFVGGCMIAVLCYAPVLWTWRGLSIGLGMAVLTGVLVCLAKFPPHYPLRAANGIRGEFLLQWVVFAVAGISIFALAAADVWKRRDAVSVLLLCWIGGTFMFSTVANWTINARSVFPMAPAAGLLVARRVEALLADKPGLSLWRFVAPLVPAACLALCVTWGDYKWANAARETAQSIEAMHKGQPGDVWYAGHWGFQYYMEKFGAKPIDYEKPQMATGDLVVLPQNNSGVYDIPKQYFSSASPPLEPRPCAWISTMMSSVGAGFYTQMWGPLPYVFGAVPPEHYYLYRFQLVKK